MTSVNSIREEQHMDCLPPKLVCISDFVKEQQDRVESSDQLNEILEVRYLVYLVNNETNIDL